MLYAYLLHGATRPRNVFCHGPHAFLRDILRSQAGASGSCRERSEAFSGVEDARARSALAVSSGPRGIELVEPLGAHLKVRARQLYAAHYFGLLRLRLTLLLSGGVSAQRSHRRA